MQPLNLDTAKPLNAEQTRAYLKSLNEGLSLLYNKIEVLERLALNPDKPLPQRFTNPIVKLDNDLWDFIAVYGKTNLSVAFSEVNDNAEA